MRNRTFQPVTLRNVTHDGRAIGHTEPYSKPALRGSSGNVSPELQPIQRTGDTVAYPASGSYLYPRIRYGY